MNMKTMRLFAAVCMGLLIASCSTRNPDESQVRTETAPAGSVGEVKTPGEAAPVDAAGTAGVLDGGGAADQNGYAGPASASVPQSEALHVEGRSERAGGAPGRYKVFGEASKPASAGAWGKRDGYGRHGLRPCPPPRWYGYDTESYSSLGENPFLAADENPLSTFSLDVDTASYSNVRRFIEGGSLPPPDAVRIEEMLNYFEYDYPEPGRGNPFSASVEVARAPWAPAHKLVRVAVKARKADAEKRLKSNLVFLLDVSGSMQAWNKLPLVKSSMLKLLKALDHRDRVAIVTYAGSAGVVLDSTPADRKGRIAGAIERLQAGGSTAGGQGLELAYDVARESFIEGGINRVILCTDGDFNVGVSDDETLGRIIAQKAKSGVFLTVLGFGMGNLKDSKLETLADKGNGAYGYIDGEREARKYMVEQVQGTLVTVAKDVKVQVEFNPDRVGSYRLIGYEDRVLANSDFSNDRKDAGDIGAGHCVTALYEVVPAGAGEAEHGEGTDLRYRGGNWRDEGSAREGWRRTERKPAGHGAELLFVKIRHKERDAGESRLLTFPVRDADRDFESASADFRFAAAVAEFGLVLRQSGHRGEASMSDALRIARASVGRDARGYRREFVELVRKATGLLGGRDLG
jgi:Ca-activated chloride channel family protein